MSNYRAIAAMTTTLCNLVQEAVKEVVPDAHVVNRPPRKENDPGQSLVSIYLYQISRNPSWRNAELPVRRADGSLAHRPQVALDLHYLLSFYGDEEALIPQLLLGRTAIALHAHPYPPPRFMPHKPLHASTHPRAQLRLWDSDLEEQVAQLQIIPDPLRHDELAKLWTLFHQVPYVLSVGYRVSVILITDGQSPEPALPVHRAALYTPSRDLPEIEAVVPQQVQYADDLTLTLRGRNLAGAQNTVVISGQAATVENGSGGVVVVRVPPGLAPGVQQVQVARDVAIGRPERPHRVFESNLATFVLRPVVVQIAADPAESKIHVRLAPTLAEGQRATLLLNEIGGDGEHPTSLSLPASRTSRGNHLSFHYKAIEPGTYLARVRVDGVTTPLLRDPDPKSPHYDRYIEPRVVIP